MMLLINIWFFFRFVLERAAGVFFFYSILLCVFSGSSTKDGHQSVETISLSSDVVVVDVVVDVEIQSKKALSRDEFSFVTSSSSSSISNSFFFKF